MRDVIIDHKEVSNGLIHFVFSRTFLHAFILKFTPMKNAPIKPPTTPIMMAARIFWYEFTSLFYLADPNLIVEPANPSTIDPSLSV